MSRRPRPLEKLVRYRLSDHHEGRCRRAALQESASTVARGYEQARGQPCTARQRVSLRCQASSADQGISLCVGRARPEQAITVTSTPLHAEWLRVPELFGAADALEPGFATIDARRLSPVSDLQKSDFLDKVLDDDLISSCELVCGHGSWRRKRTAGETSMSLRRACARARRR